MGLTLAGAVDERIYRGTDRVIQVQIRDDFTGDTYDMTGHSLYLTMAMSPLDDVPVLTKDGELVVAAIGACRFVFTPEDTEGMIAYSYYTTIFVEDDSTEEIWPVYEGKIAVVPAVQREVT